MSSHRYHAPGESDLILVDDCPRCAEHADRPWGAVDRERLDRLTAMALRWEYGEPRCTAAGVPPERQPESVGEREACQRIVDAISAAHALAGIGDGVPEWFARTRRQGLATGPRWWSTGEEEGMRTDRSVGR